MAIKQLHKNNIPDFEMPIDYMVDQWNIKEWDYYKNSSEDIQKSWNNRSSVTNGTLDFSVCNNTIIREEFKYCFYFFIDIKGLSLRTMAEKYDHLKHVMNFINTKDYTSLTDIKDSTDFQRYIVFTIGNKAETKNGNRIEASSMTYVSTSKRNRVITFLETCINKVKDFYEKDIPEIEKDIWHCKNMPIDGLRSSGKTLNFSSIKNEEFKQQAKDLCYNRLGSICWDSTVTFLLYIKRFMLWLAENNPEIKHMNELTRNIMEDYFCWLRFEKDHSQYQTNISILSIKLFFEYGQLLEFKNFPQLDLMTTKDYAFKTKKESQYMTDEEVKNLMAAVPKIHNKMYGKMIYVLLMTGMRISELLGLSVNSLKQFDDGCYYLTLFQFKTLDEYEKPINDGTARILSSEIIKNKKCFGNESKYIFVNDNNKPIVYGTFCRNINKALVDFEVKDKNGQPLKFNMHRMRATYATNLFKSGEDPKGTAQLMGQKTLESLAHYVVIKNSEVKRELKPRIAKDEILISNIGHIDNAIISKHEHIESLCNGWCVRNNTLGTCKKANNCLSCNMFIPTEKHLVSYQLQLNEVEASIIIAKANRLDSMLEKNLQTKKMLEDIIAKVKKKMENRINEE